MRPLPWRKNGCSWLHRLCVVVALSAYVVVALGVPLPAFARKDHSQPFPCQDDACGCQSAEQCWRHCCCYTPEQHWAWAREHGIQPPAYATPPGAEARHKPAPCCAGSHATHEHSTHGKAAKRSTQWFVAWAHQRCRGADTAWVMAGAVLPLRPVAAWTPRLLPLGWLVDLRDTAISHHSLPPEPPPRPAL